MKSIPLSAASDPPGSGTPSGRWRRTATSCGGGVHGGRGGRDGRRVRAPGRRPRARPRGQPVEGGQLRVRPGLRPRRDHQVGGGHRRRARRRAVCAPQPGPRSVGPRSPASSSRCSRLRRLRCTDPVHREAQPEAARGRRSQPAAPGLPLLGRGRARTRRRSPPSMLFLDEATARQRLPAGRPGEPRRRGVADRRTDEDPFATNEIDGGAYEDVESVPLELPAGSVVMFGSYLVHHSAAEHVARPRARVAVQLPAAGRAAHDRVAPQSPRCGVPVVSDTTVRPATTISDVARAASVSPATVSRALNGTGPVSPARAARVRDAAERLGYLPSGPARALRRQVNQVWAAIVADIGNPFFTAVVRGIEDGARAEDHRLVLCNSDEDVDTEAAYVDVVVAERMAGVVIAVASPAESDLAAPARPGHPGGRRRPPPRRCGRRLGRRSTTASAAKTRPRHLLEHGSRADRLHHRTGTRRHGERAPAGLPRRPRPARCAGRPRAGPPGRLQARRRLPHRPVPARVTLAAGRAVRRQRADDDRRAASAARARPAHPRRRRARRLRRRAVDHAPEPTGHGRVPARVRDRAGGGRAAGLRCGGPARRATSSAPRR